MSKYDNDSYNQFQKDCEEAGMEVKEYHGRFYYVGPAVFTNEDDWPTRDDVVRATTVKLQYDNLAFDWVVYPK